MSLINLNAQKRLGESMSDLRSGPPPEPPPSGDRRPEIIEAHDSLRNAIDALHPLIAELEKALHPVCRPPSDDESDPKRTAYKVALAETIAIDADVVWRAVNRLRDLRSRLEI